MEYRKLGGTDLEISAIGFGAWGIGGAPFWNNEGDAASARALRKALDLGINFFDTAPVYGFGHSETLIGKTLKPVRDKVIYATKCGLRWSQKALKGISHNAKKSSIFEEIEDSLKRMQTDYIDLYQVHWPDSKTPQEETMEALLELQRQGKIRHIGVSNYSVEQMQACLKVGRIVSLQPEYSLVNRSIEKETVPFCRENHIGIIAYSPLASGVLTGKYDKNTRFTDWRGKGIIGTFSGDGYHKIIDRVERLKELAGQAGKTCGQMAINWIVHQPGLTCALLGVKNDKQMEENVQALGWTLGSEQSAEIDRVFAREG
ncbi:MAG: oxidoreductase [Nitrospinae bacterium CG11_big_fil_rev_8_21_14_0_20_56_8]|nr:MAG: oxidoreductase [Nitrospinae bacterium CG11_big_fil_rev_8_21_14_0_20_56_8]